MKKLNWIVNLVLPVFLASQGNGGVGEILFNPNIEAESSTEARIVGNLVPSGLEADAQGSEPSKAPWPADRLPALKSL